MTKKMFGTLSFAALMSAIVVRLFSQLAFGGELPAQISISETANAETSTITMSSTTR
jgi:hypothetical protein